MKAGTRHGRSSDGPGSHFVRTPRSWVQRQSCSPLPGTRPLKSGSATGGLGRTHAKTAGKVENTEGKGDKETENETSFKVAVRVRQISARERLEAKDFCCSFDGGGRLLSLPPPQSRAYEFDRVFPPDSTQEDIYSYVSLIVRAAVSGFNAALLAYGQTGTGKTYTLGFERPPKEAPEKPEGDSRDGVLPRACRDLFCLQEEKKNSCIAKGERLDWQVTCSFLELYNEEIRDLLAEGPFLKSLLIRRDTVSGQLVVQDLRAVSCCSPQDLLACLRKGLQKRSTAACAQNNVSSRSHAIFSISLRQQITSATPSDAPRSKEETAASSSTAAAAVSSSVVFSLLHFVDLAGSERGKKSGSEGLRLAEGIAINSGLLALAKVIRALTQQQKKMGQQQQQQHHVPYRDSKLTRLLEPVLGGNSKAVMIACVSPLERDLHETLQTLDYAARARLIRNNPTINTKSNGDLIASLREEIVLLKDLLSSRETADLKRNPDALPQEGQQQEQQQQEQGQQQQQEEAAGRQSSSLAGKENKQDEMRAEQLRQALHHLTEEATKLRHRVKALERQLQQQLEGQQLQQQQQFSKTAAAHAALAGYAISTEKNPEIAAASATATSGDTEPEETLEGKELQQRQVVAGSLKGDPAEASPQGGAPGHQQCDAQQELLQVQQEHLLLLREQQLQQPVQQQQQQQQQLLPAAEPVGQQEQLQGDEQKKSRYQQTSPVQQLQQEHLQENQPKQLRPEQYVHQKQLHQNQPAQLEEQGRAISEGDPAVSKPSEVYIHSGEQTTGWKTPRNAAEHHDAPQPISFASFRRRLALQSCAEGRKIGSPLSKRQRKEKLPAVFFSVVKEAHDTPVKKVCFLSVEPRADAGGTPAASLLTGSDGSLKVWDIKRMATRWRYILKGLQGFPAAEAHLSLWGIAAALSGTLIVAGIGSRMLTFDLRAGRPQSRDSWGIRNCSSHCLAVGDEGSGAEGHLLFVSSPDGFVRLYDLRQLHCGKWMQETECSPASSLCCLPSTSPFVSSAVSLFPRLAVSSLSGSPRICISGAWVSLGGPCCTSLAALPRSCVEQPWSSLHSPGPPHEGSILAALEEERGTLRVWDLPLGVSTFAVLAKTPRPSLPFSRNTPAAAASLPTIAPTSAQAAAAHLTSLAAWEERCCFVTANKTGEIRFWNYGIGCPAETPEVKSSLTTAASSLQISPHRKLLRRLCAGNTPVTALATAGRDLLASVSSDGSLRLFRIESD